MYGFPFNTKTRERKRERERASNSTYLMEKVRQREIENSTSLIAKYLERGRRAVLHVEQSRFESESII